MLFAPLVSAASIRSFRRVGQRVGQGENSPLKNCAAVIKDYGKSTAEEATQSTDYSVARRITKELIAASQQKDSRTNITRSAGEYKSLS